LLMGGCEIRLLSPSRQSFVLDFSRIPQSRIRNARLGAVV